MIRKHMMFVMALIALLAIAGCGGKKATTAPPPTEPTDNTSTAPQVEETTPATPDPATSDQLDVASLSDAYFDFDSYSLSSEAKGTLEQNAKAIKGTNSGNVTIEGHCDERGTRRTTSHWARSAPTRPRNTWWHSV